MDTASLPVYVLDSSHGLGSNQIHRIASDAQSRLLLATPVGLARFDGSFTQRWSRQSGLQCNGLRSVAVGANGEIWVGTDQGLELLDAAGKPVRAIEPGAWRFGLCQHIVASGPNPWVGTALGLVRLERIAASAGYEAMFIAETGFVSALLRFTDQRVLAASASCGLIESDGKLWWRYRCQALIGKKIVRLGAASAGHILVGTDDGAFVIDDETKSSLGRLALADVNPSVSAIAIGVDRYWIAFGRTLVAFSSDPKNPVLLERFTLESEINDLCPDSLGNVWIATNASGLAKVSCLRFALWRIDIGRPRGVYSIKPSGADRFTLGGEQLLETVELSGRTSVTSVNNTNGLPETIVWDSFEDAHGIWVATQAGLYYAARGERFAARFANDPLLGAPNRVLIQRAGELWVGSLRGLARIRGSVAEPVEGGGRPLGYVYAMHIDSSDALWVGTLGRGLWREREGGSGALQQITVAPLSNTGNTYAVSQGPDGRMIVLQDEFVVLLDHDLSAHVVTQIAPVAGWAVCWINERTVAIGGSDGLRVLDLVTGRVIRLVQALFPLRGWEFTNNRTLVRDDRGRFLCGLTSGLVRVDLELLDRYAPPECKLVDIVWKGVQAASYDGVYRLRPGRWTFTVRAFSAWMIDSSQVRYQFHLVGFDDDWSELVERPEVSFTSLPSGKYRLLARAFSPLAGLGPEAELMQLEVSRPLWALGWSQALLTIESRYDSLVRSRARNEALLRTNQELEQAVQARTAALEIANQNLVATRDAYQKLSEVDELTGLGNRRSFEKEVRRSIKLAQRLELPLAMLMIDVDHFKAVNDTYGHLVGDNYLQQIAKVIGVGVRQGEDVPTRFGGEEFAVLLVNTRISGAMAVAERIRAMVQELALKSSSTPLGVATVSVGVAVAVPTTETTPDALANAADAALYRAKKSGRNCVVAEG